MADTTSTVIVALPEENDYVHKISSEAKPHMTLMYLGDNFDMTNFETVVQYIEHVAKTSMRRFGLSVDRRGTLGPKDADVLFFEDGWQTKEIKQIQGWLRGDPTIETAYLQSKQYAQWTPHLTLGYPETPAHEDTRDYPGISYVHFDRIAIWTGDYEGPEFRLKSWGECSPELAMSDEAQIGASFTEYFLNEEVLEHHGVLGMRWGKHKTETLQTYTSSKAAEAGGMIDTKTHQAQLKALRARDAQHLAEAKKHPDFREEVEAAKRNEGVFKSVWETPTKMEFLKGGYTTSRLLPAPGHTFTNSKGKPVDADFANAVLAQAGHELPAWKRNVSAKPTAVDHDKMEAEMQDFVKREMAHGDDDSEEIRFADDVSEEEFLAHFGVKGMQWGKHKMVDTGVTSTGTSKLEAKAAEGPTRAVRKADQMFIKENTGINGFIKVNNGIAERINPRLDAMNAAHTKKYGDIDITQPGHEKALKEYADTYKANLQKSLDEVAASIGSNASGTIKANLKVIDNGYPDISYEYTLNEVKHADGELKCVITPKFSAKGYIVGQTFKMVVPEELAHSDEFAEFVLGGDLDELALAHYGVKGMQWGVRRNGTPSGVEIKVTPGRRVKSSGGKNETASEDAKQAAIVKQKAKASTTDALSNAELKKLIERMQLEANYERLQKQSAGRSFVRKMFSNKDARQKSIENLRDLNQLTMPARKAAAVPIHLSRDLRDVKL